MNLCNRCGTPNDGDHSLCLRCGAPLYEGLQVIARPADVDTDPEARHKPGREQRHVTVMSCDLVGSTALAERLGPDTTHALFERLYELVLAEVSRNGGTVNEFLGDGLMVQFDGDDHARRGVMAGIGIQRSLQQRISEFAETRGDFRLRIGLHSGVVVVGRIRQEASKDYTAANEVTNIATQLQSRADPGWVHVSAATRDLAGMDFNWEHAADRLIPGLVDPIEVFRTRELTPTASALLDRAPVSYTPAHLASKILSTRATLESERKQITVLFCGLDNPTALARRVGPETMHMLLERFFDLALAEVSRYEGTIHQFRSDGLMASFGAPVAHEDHARRAVLAGIGILRCLEERARDFASAGEFRLRIGLNSGIVVVGKIGDDLRMSYTPIGDVTNLAARVESDAEPGWVYTSEATHRLAGPFFDWEFAGTRAVKGLSRPVEFYRTRKAASETAPGPDRMPWATRSPLVGRDAELDQLISAVQTLGNEEHGGLFGIIGDPGLGKSRLLLELNEATAGDDIEWLEGRALSFGQSLSHWMFVDMLRNWIGVREDESSARGLAELQSRITELFPDSSEEVLPYLIVLLGLPLPPSLEPKVKFLDGHAIGLQIFLSVRRWVQRLARLRPVVLVLEDLHWSDETSTDLIEHLLPLVETERLLIIGTSRNDPHSVGARVRHLATTEYRRVYTEFQLSPLPVDLGRVLVTNLLDGPGLGTLRERVVARAEGNPFFAEEIVRSLVESGGLKLDPGTGRWSATGDLDRIEIPDSLQGVIAARIDLLDDQPKQVLKMAAVIGRSFLYRILDAIASAGRQLESQLSGLVQLELIREQRRTPELEYWFTHALVHETAYDSILVNRRQELHRQVADSIVALFGNQIDEYAGILAHHYTRAAEWAKAQKYLLMAGDQALRTAGNAEALSHYREAIDACSQAFGNEWDPVERAILERKIGEAFFRRGDHQQAVRHFSDALAGLGAPYPTTTFGIVRSILWLLFRQLMQGFKPRARDAGATGGAITSERCRMYGQMAWMHFFQDQKLVLLDVLLALDTANRDGHVADVCKGAAGVGIAFDVFGMYAIGARYHHAGLKMAATVDHPIAKADAHMGAAMNYAYSGHLQLAREHSFKAAALFRSAGEMRPWGAYTGIVIHLGRYVGTFDELKRLSSEVREVGEETGDKHLIGWGLQGFGKAQITTGDLEDGMKNLNRALELHEAIPAPTSAAEAHSDLAICEMHLGRIDDAVERLEQANRVIKKHGLRSHDCTGPHNLLVEAYLLQAQRSEGFTRTQWLNKARRASRASLAHARSFRPAYPWAARLQGNIEWLCGKQKAARRWWQRSLDAGSQIGTHYLKAHTHLDMGRYLHDEQHLIRAQTIFKSSGAVLDLEKVNDALQALSSTDRRSF